MTVARLYRRTPPSDYDWTELDAFNQRVIFRELMQQVDSIRSFCGATATDWASVTAPPNGDPMLENPADVVDGWPSAHYFGVAIWYIAYQILGAMYTEKSIGPNLYVWESPDTWEEEDPSLYSAPTEFSELFDPAGLFGFGDNFSDFPKWKHTVEVLRRTCDSLQVMFNNAGVIGLPTGTSTIYRQTPQEYNQAFTFVQYIPLDTPLGVADGIRKWRSFSPTPYANSILEQYFCTSGGPPTTTVGVDFNNTSTSSFAKVYCGSIVSSFSGDFRTLWYNPSSISSQSYTHASQVPFGIGRTNGSGVRTVLYPRAGVRCPLEMTEVQFEDGQAVPYKNFPGTPSEVSELRSLPYSFAAVSESSANERIAAATARGVCNLGYFSSLSYPVTYNYAIDEDRVFVIRFSYPVSFSRDYTDAEFLALTINVTYSIDGHDFTLSLAPNATATETKTVHISDSSISLDFEVSNASSVIQASANMWKVNPDSWPVPQTTDFYTSTGETVNINGTVATILENTAQFTGRINTVVLDEALASGALQIAVNRV